MEMSDQPSIYQTVSNDDNVTNQMQKTWIVRHWDEERLVIIRSDRSTYSRPPNQKLHSKYEKFVFIFLKRKELQDIYKILKFYPYITLVLLKWRKMNFGVIFLGRVSFRVR